MTANSKIEWCHHTFNPWWGCQRVSPGCEHCYAETFSKRLGLKLWGPESAGTPRRFFGEKHWAEPLKWDAAAAKAGERHRVFCASMADVFEDRAELEPWRERLWTLIGATPNLDWLLLTKRPENARRMLPAPAFDDPHNVWLGCTAEDQRRADERIPHLLSVPAAIHFVSYEPALGPVLFDNGESSWFTCNRDPIEGHCCESWDVRGVHFSGVDWVIVGGESGPGARPLDLAWARSTIEQCRAAGVPCFVKQLGARPVGQWVDVDGVTREPPRLDDRKGGDIVEWPFDLRVREWPEAQQ